MNEKEFRKSVSEMTNKELAMELASKPLLSDIRKILVDEAVKRFIEEHSYPVD